MGYAFVVLRWPPGQFWKSTLREYNAAVRAADKQSGDVEAPLSRDEFAALKEKHG
ncbi:MAG: phage tail assembly chaperone [Sphingomonadales bacterium]